MSTKNTTKTSQETMTLKYGYMWVETTAVKVTAAGEKVTTVTKKIARDPQVGFFRKIFRI
jgi:hypothetical protein